MLLIVFFSIRKKKIDFLFAICSAECKSVIDDGLPDVAASLLAAFDGGELLGALEEGQSGWQKWVKSFGKSLKRKVCFYYCILDKNLLVTGIFGCPKSLISIFMRHARENLFLCPSGCC